MKPAMIVAGLILAGCSTMPGSGPTTRAMLGDDAVIPVAIPDAEAYALLPMTVQSAKLMNAAVPLADTAMFLPDTPPPRTGLGPGDALEVTIVSVNPAGFVDFAQSAVTPIATNTLPVQEVDATGTITVPPLGRVRVRGMSVPRLEAMLTNRLSEVLVDPSVVVRVAERVSGQVSVVGQVVSPGRHAAAQPEARLLDLIGIAGGPALPAEELRLTLTRQGRSVSVRLDRLLADPELNIRVWPGDVITLEEAVSEYSLIGATNAPDAYEWSARRLTLVRALAESGGAEQLFADRHGVFVLRSVPRQALAAVSGLQVERLPDPAPTVLQFDFSEPTGLLAAQQFEIRDDDLVYVSVAPVVEVGKITTSIVPILSMTQRAAAPALQ